MAVKHRVLDIIVMGFQTVDDIGNARRKKCINLYSPDQDNRDVCLVSVSIIEGRGGEDHIVDVHLCYARSLVEVALLNSVNRLTRYYSCLIVYIFIFLTKSTKSCCC